MQKMNRQNRNLRTLVFFEVLSLILFSGLVQAKTTYTYSTHVLQAALSCEQEAQNLKSNFLQATGATILSATCDGTVQIQADQTSYNLFALSVQYTPAADINPVSVSIGEDHTVYTAFKDCLNDLSTQKQNFTDNLGLQVVSASCLPTSTSSDAYPMYALLIDGFGSTGTHFYSYDVQSLDAGALNFIQSAVNQQGGHVTLTKAGYVFYYSVNPLIMGHLNLGSFSSAQECLTQIQSVQDGFLGWGAKLVSLSCSDTQMTIFEDARIDLAEDFGANSKTYYSFDECVADKSKVVSNGAIGVCLPVISQNGQYKIDFISPN